jgi:hypothetical protein
MNDGGPHGSASVECDGRLIIRHSGVYSTGAWRPSAGKLGFKDDFGEVSCFSVDYLM